MPFTASKRNSTGSKWQVIVRHLNDSRWQHRRHLRRYGYPEIRIRTALISGCSCRPLGPQAVGTMCCCDVVPSSVRGSLGIDRAVITEPVASITLVGPAAQVQPRVEDLARVLLRHVDAWSQRSMQPREPI